MSSCNKKILCSYYTRRITVNKAEYDANVKKYCQGSYSQCARYMVFEKVGLLGLSDDLKPQDAHKARQIISRR